MSDEDEATPARRPTPNPASRARRIGGRPTPRPSGAPSPGPTSERARSVSIEKPDIEKPAPGYGTAPRPNEPAPRSRGRGLLRWIPAIVLGAGVIALVVLIVIASRTVYWSKPDDSAGARTERQEQVLAAAKKCFAQINTYDYRKLTGLVQQDTACTTGTFTKDLTRALTSQIIPIAPRLKATQTAQVNRAGIASVSSNGKQVVTLMYGQLAQTNSTTAKTSPRIDVVGAVVTVDKVGNQWLISKVDTDVGNTLSP